MAMKGEYRIVMELFLFLIGIIIAVFTLSTFSGLQADTEKVSLEDQLGGVANDIINGVVKAAENQSIVRVEVPEKLSGKIYSMRFSDAEDALLMRTLELPNIEITRQLFNISKSHDITGEVVSTARFIEITNDGRNIQLRRGSL